MKRFYDLNKEEDVELLRQLALASDEEDGDDVFSESEEGEFEEAEAELEETSQDPLPGPSNSRSCTYQSRKKAWFLRILRNQKLKMRTRQ